MTATTPAPRPRPGAPARRAARSGPSDGPPRRRRIRWGRIPGRLILAVCFVAGALALAVAVVPFSTTTDDGTELRCGPPVFEVLMPPDPSFDDTPENGGCAERAEARLVVGGAVLVGAMFVAAITERRTRRGSVRRDTQWLSSTASKSARRREDRRAAKRGPSKRRSPSIDRSSATDPRSLPSSRS